MFYFGRLSLYSSIYWRDQLKRLLKTSFIYVLCFECVKVLYFLPLIKGWVKYSGRIRTMVLECSNNNFILLYSVQRKLFLFTFQDSSINTLFKLLWKFLLLVYTMKSLNVLPFLTHLSHRHWVRRSETLSKLTLGLRIVSCRLLCVVDVAFTLKSFPTIHVWYLGPRESPVLWIEQIL